MVYADANDNHRLDDGEVSTVTDSDGNWTLSLTPGEYTIRQITPSGWRATRNWSGRQVVVTAGEDASTIDPINFGEVDHSVDNWYQAWIKRQAEIDRSREHAIDFSRGLNGR